MLTASVKTSAFLDNIKRVKSRVKKKLIAVVKADAYGHGAVGLCKASENAVDEFAVADIKEALELFENGIVKRINLLAPLDPQTKIIPPSVVPVISSPHDLQILEKNKPLIKEVNIEIDTGMNRLGFFPHELENAKQRIEGLGYKVRSVYSHLYNGFDLVASKKQREIFTGAVKALGYGHSSPLIHLAASNCLSLPNDFLFSAVRVGLCLYGYSHLTSPFLEITAPILRIFPVKKGESVGYGEYKAPRDMLIGAIRAGYADGVRRKDNINAENRFFAVNKTLCPIIGQVCMDITMIDVSKVEKLSYNNKAYILGGGVTAQMIADAESTIVYEVLTGFKGRVKRVFC